VFVRIFPGKEAESNQTEKGAGLEFGRKLTWEVSRLPKMYKAKKATDGFPRFRLTLTQQPQ